MVAVYCDGADLGSMAAYVSDPRINGFTTNPSLMKRAKIEDYRSYAKAVLGTVAKKPVSFEVLADTPEEMAQQAMEIASWGSNVYVKVPITDTKGALLTALIKKLSDEGLKLNVTAVMTYEQIMAATLALKHGDHILSIFAGRIADTGRDPSSFIRYAKGFSYPGTKILWASAREIYNVIQAELAGADIITLTPELLGKLAMRGKDLHDYSLETVQQFYADGRGIAFAS